MTSSAHLSFLCSPTRFVFNIRGIVCLRTTSTDTIVSEAIPSEYLSVLKRGAYSILHAFTQTRWHAALPFDRSEVKIQF